MSSTLYHAQQLKKMMAEEGPKEKLGEGGEDSKAREEIEGYLNKRMRVSLSDGRVIDGMFLCTDRDCNMVLGNCEEFLSQEEVDDYEKKSGEAAKFLKQPRTLSLAIVPGEHILAIALAKEHHHQATPTSHPNSSQL